MPDGREALPVFVLALCAPEHLLEVSTSQVAEAVVSVGLSPETTAGAGLELALSLNRSTRKVRGPLTGLEAGGP